MKSENKQSGQIIIVSLVFMGVAVALVGSLVLYSLVQIRAHRQAVSREKALNIAEAGLESAIWKLNNQANYLGENNTSFADGTYSVTVTTLSGSSKLIKVEAYQPSPSQAQGHRIVQATVTIGTKNIGFNYGVQVGAGGLEMDNNSQVFGNVYSDGSITGANGNTFVTGDAIVAGSGTINTVIVQGNASVHNIVNSTVGKNANVFHLDNTNVTGNVSANDINNCNITGDAAFNANSGCKVSGNITQPNNNVPTDPPGQDLPIDESQVTDWQTEAQNGGVIGTQTVNGSVSLGPVKINGNLTVNGTLTITGTLWVTGNITLNNGSIVQLSPSFGALSGVVVAGSFGNTSNGYINMSNGVVIKGSGTAGSYLMLLSERDTTATPGFAISASNNSTAAILYANNGTIEVSNNAQLKEITGWRIHLNNSSTVTYDSGLASTSFSSGPGGGWQLADQTWQLLQ